MLKDYKVVVLLGPNGFSPHQSSSFIDTTKTIRDSTEDAVITVPLFCSHQSKSKIPKIIFAQEVPEKLQVVSRSFNRDLPLSDIAELIKSERYDQVLAYPGKQHRNSSRCRVWGLCEELEKLGMVITVALPWLAEWRR